jgi:hypothetical protein
MLVAIDKFTKWVEAAPVTTQDSTAAIKFIKSIVFRFRVPQHYHRQWVTRVNSTNVLDEGLRSGEEQRLEIPGSRLAHDVPRFTSPRWRIATSC